MLYIYMIYILLLYYYYDIDIYIYVYDKFFNIYHIYIFFDYKNPIFGSK